MAPLLPLISPPVTNFRNTHSNSWQLGSLLCKANCLWRYSRAGCVRIGEVRAPMVFTQQRQLHIAGEMPIFICFQPIAQCTTLLELLMTFSYLRNVRVLVLLSWSTAFMTWCVIGDLIRALYIQVHVSCVLKARVAIWSSVVGGTCLNWLNRSTYLLLLLSVSSNCSMNRKTCAISS